MRLFASVRPPDPVLDHLRSALDLAGLGARSDGLRLTAEETWHLTVAFFGDVPDGALAELEDLLAEVAAGRPAFELRLRGAGVFSGRTVWVGASGDVAAMAELASGARAAGEQVSRFRDTRARLRPHLTVARVTGEGAPPRRGRRSEPAGAPARVEAIVHALALYEGPAWTVDGLVLEQSWPGQGRGGGPRYEQVSRWVLPPVAG